MTDQSKKQIVVMVIPTYDEKGNIGRAIDELQTVFMKVPDNYEMHILVVDDSSPDGTADEVREKMKKLKNVHLLINKKKMGLGGAYLSGMKYAVEKLNPDIFFEFDADLSHDPKLVPQFLAKLEEGYDLVLGSRYIKGGAIPDNWGLKRKFYSVVGNMIIMFVLTDFSIRDWTTGYRAIRRYVYDKVHPLLGEERFFGYTFQIGFLHKAVRAGFKAGEVPLKFVDRTLGRSKLGAEYIKNTLIYIFKARFFELLRFFKFVAVGSLGLVIQTAIYWLLGFGLKLFSPAIATILGGQVAILSNFILNNVWTFGDRKITSTTKLFQKLIAFYTTSNIAVLLIQGGIMKAGEMLVGKENILIHGFYVAALVLTLIFNFTVYNKYIWKK
ncbi:glycosyltransferase family 2 protein [Candidatus Collierbacteria bacterium]|nr:glycosyltransferase family 2 protein [Candidatus Collierbacteria bacterium]